MDDLISRQAAIDVVNSETVSTNPEHFKSSEKFIKFMDDADIASFGKWQWANGFNTALVATTIHLKDLPSAQPDENMIHLQKEQAYMQGWEDGREALRNMPSDNQWIPCSKRLPEGYKEVWVTIKGFDVIHVEEGETMKEAAERVSKIRWVTRGSWSEEEKCWIDNKFGFPLVCQPIAWMEMNEPEPWKGEEDGTAKPV